MEDTGYFRKKAWMRMKKKMWILLKSTPIHLNAPGEVRTTNGHKPFADLRVAGCIIPQEITKMTNFGLHWCILDHFNRWKDF